MRNKILAVGGVLAAALIYFWLVPTFRGDFVMQSSFGLGLLTVHWYGVVLAAALFSAYLVCRANAWRFGLAREEVDRFGFWLVIVAVLSARLYFVLFEASYYLSNPGEIIQVWNGGLSIFGAILGGLLFTWLYSRRKIYSFWQVADLVALGLPVGQAIGRLGNFINYEAYGSPTGLPWRMFVPEGSRLADAAFYHPTFLYEAIGSIVIFFILLRLRGRVSPGIMALVYLAAYGLLRACIEPLRLDSVFVAGFRADQVVAAVIWLAATGALIGCWRQKPE